MTFTFWFVIAGTVFILMALSATVLKRLPLTTSLLYLAIGYLVSRFASNLFSISLLDNSLLLERLTEIVVLISLFCAGLKLRTPFSNWRWSVPVRLASVSMLVTIGLMTAAAVYGLGLPLGVAVLLAAMLAPTDPVLASDVQVSDPGDQDKLRFGLTGEAGLNDGAAFPFVMLGLGLLGEHELGAFGWRWFAIDVVWAVGGGLAIGWLLGTVIGRLVIFLRSEHKEAVGLDDFLALGLIALSYGVALLATTYGFLAVFAAGLALRRVETRATGDRPAEEVRQMAQQGEKEQISTDAEAAPAYMAEAVLGFDEQLERIGEVVVVVLIGGLLATIAPSPQLWWFAPLLLLVVRPIAVAIGLIGARATTGERRLISWFGIRGIGSVYYLGYAIEHGLPEEFSPVVASIVLWIVGISIVVHGISVTPLMNRYRSAQEGQ